MKLRMITGMNLMYFAGLEQKFETNSMVASINLNNCLGYSVTDNHQSKLSCSQLLGLKYDANDSLH